MANKQRTLRRNNYIMGHYDCSYCGESMGDRCCSASIADDDFGKIQTRIYKQAKDEAEQYYKDLVAKKENELYNKYKWNAIRELYLRVLNGKMGAKSQRLSNGRYRIYGLVDAWEAHLFEL